MPQTTKTKLKKEAKMPKKQNKKKVSLRDDLTFKHFFKNNKKALISLLENFLPLPKGRGIQKVQILDSVLPSFEKRAKETLMDLRLTMDNKELVNVEMQMCSHKFFTERVLYYWAKNYISQLTQKSKYHQLTPVYSLIFCDFGLLSKTRDFYSPFSIRLDREPYFALNQHLRMVFVELKKFKKGDIKSLVDIREAWCYLLRWFEDMGERERQLFAEQNQGMEELMDWTRPLSLEEQEKVLEEARVKNWRDRMAREDYVFERGMEKGIKKGIKDGMEKGMEKGRMERDREVILNMLKKSADMVFISEVTGLSVDEIKKLTNGSC